MEAAGVRSLLLHSVIVCIIVISISIIIIILALVFGLIVLPASVYQRSGAARPERVRANQHHPP